mmetsp:Transcript_22011/g.41036  ORF Transcript_22011/g.41036 Transcript_22011/m.41036 type:complete len:100 (+) Transcript_22011:458-757(+)
MGGILRSRFVMISSSSRNMIELLSSSPSPSVLTKLKSQLSNQKQQQRKTKENKNKHDDYSEEHCSYFRPRRRRYEFCFGLCSFDPKSCNDPDDEKYQCV